MGTTGASLDAHFIPLLLKMTYARTKPLKFDQWCLRFDSLLAPASTHDFTQVANVKKRRDLTGRGAWILLAPYKFFQVQLLLSPTSKMAHELLPGGLRLGLHLVTPVDARTAAMVEAGFGSLLHVARHDAGLAQNVDPLL